MCCIPVTRETLKMYHYLRISEFHEKIGTILCAAFVIFKLHKVFKTRLTVLTAIFVRLKFQ